jgi:proteasome-associated ATPase
LAATNVAAQLDPALTRPGRLDLKLLLSAPNRKGAEQILRCYLGNELPCTATVDELIQPLLGSIYSPRSPYAQLATVKLNDGRQLSITARELISGAMLEGLVRRASREAAVREAESGRAGGLSATDLAQALDAELLGITSLLSPMNVKSYVRSIPHDAHPVDVRTTTSGRGAYVRI